MSEELVDFVHWLDPNIDDLEVLDVLDPLGSLPELLEGHDVYTAHIGSVVEQRREVWRSIELDSPIAGSDLNVEVSANALIKHFVLVDIELVYLVSVLSVLYHSS